MKSPRRLKSLRASVAREDIVLVNIWTICNIFVKWHNILKFWKTIDGIMAGSFVLESALQEILIVVKPSEVDRLTRLNVINYLKGVVQTVESLRGATVEPYGSFISNLYSKWGDLDISVEPLSISSSDVRSRKLDLLRKIKKALQRRGVHKLEFIQWARVPILKFESDQSISCDISIDNLLCQIKSKYFLWISDIDERFRDMVLLVKEWAKAQGINDPKNGTFNSYSLTLLVIFHFQTCKPSILPPLMSIFDGNIADLIGMQSHASIETTCAENIARFKRERYSRNQSTLSELFVSFFEKFSKIKRKSAKHVLCTYTGNWELKRSQSRWMMTSSPILIEDPFEQTENAARSVGSFDLRNIAETFQETHQKLSSVLSKKSLIPILVRPEICGLLGVRAPQRDLSRLQQQLHQMNLDSPPSSSVSANRRRK
ncbi:protein HESO1-like isoform X2 [Aristolochia californica]|uniref:protein HESO1-like isoform X2 n=1 Tax=Aristolochia californica TaxID=171875 RepID=UPI0035DF5227